MIKAFLVSDAHICTKESDTYRCFLKFLDHVLLDDGTHLFIIGDLFEFLYGKGEYAISHYNELFDELKKLSDKGVKIYYLYGNHDFNLELPFDFIESTPRIDLMDIAGRKTVIYHGDGLDPSDYKYRFLKRIVRGPLFRLLTKMVPDLILYRTANICSMFSRLMNRKKRLNIERTRHYRDYALDLLNNTEAQTVVLAHTHIPELVTVDIRGQKKDYMNTGFFGENRSYGIMDDKGVYLCVFNGKC